MEQQKTMTQKQALAFYDAGEWRQWDSEQIVKFQLFQERLCVPFQRFHKAAEAVLGRPVFTHEFADGEGLKREYLRKRNNPASGIEAVRSTSVERARTPKT